NPSVPGWGPALGWRRDRRSAGRGRGPGAHRAARRDLGPGRARRRGALGGGAAVLGRAGARPVRRVPAGPAVARAALARPRPGRPGPRRGRAQSTASLARAAFCAGADAIRAAIAAGDVYQVNLTRRLSAPLPPGADVAALGAALGAGNPAPYAAVVRLPALGC